MKYTLDELKKMMEVKGGSLYLRGTQITALPDGLTVGGYLDLRGTQITGKKDYKKLKNGMFVDGRYIYADNIFTHVKRSKKIGEYTYHIGKIKGQNVVQKGSVFAHCKDFESGVRDIEFKERKNRGAEQYAKLTHESTVKKNDAIIMYRVITGACQAGTQRFLDGLGETKDEYTVAEIIELTRGQYGGRQFEEFFNKKK